MQETTVFTYRVSLPPMDWAKASLDASPHGKGGVW